MTKHVMIVDDEAGLLALLDIAFTGVGYRVTTAKTGFAAFSQLLGDDHPHAVIVGDLSPRPETSLALVNDIRVAFTGTAIPILMLSTQTQESDQMVGLAAGADCYVTKPFQVRTLVEMVESLIAA